MKPVDLFLMDMTTSGHTSGVDRYLEVLTKGLQRVPEVRLHRIQLIEGGNRLFVRRIGLPEGGIHVQIPLPCCMSEILTKSFWTRKYNEQVYRLTHDLFEGKERMVFHLHTLNLIDLACYLRERVPACRIITHLHCIPWKALYNTDRPLFNRLYETYYVQRRIPREKGTFLRLESEWNAYHRADRVICVTECAREFLERLMGRTQGVYVIPNGMNSEDTCSVGRNYVGKAGELRCLYVGVVSHSKGIRYILEALRKVGRRGYRVSLIACGTCSAARKKQLLAEYDDVSVELKGQVSYETLRSYYRSCDVGVIASLQEQSSYVAIEMMRFGMPVITTAVDGLDEMFRDGVDSMKVKVPFSTAFGLSVDTDAMADCMIHLSEHPEERKRLGENAYRRYRERFGLERMMREMVAVYDDVWKEKNK